MTTSCVGQQRALDEDGTRRHLTDRGSQRTSGRGAHGVSTVELRLLAFLKEGRELHGMLMGSFILMWLYQSSVFDVAG